MFLAAVSFYLRLFRLSGTQSGTFHQSGLGCIPPYVDVLESIPSHILLNLTVISANNHQSMYKNK